MIWEVILYESKKNKPIHKIIKSLLHIFCFEYTPGIKRKRKYIIYFAISLLTQPVDNKCKSKYNHDYKRGDILNSILFHPSTFTHITCLYFTIYYVEDKLNAFKNFYDWLKPGGYLIVNLVNRNKFDPIVSAGDPLLMVSPQKYAKKRITNTVVKFNNFQYKSNFELDKSNNRAYFKENFKHDKDGKVRKNEHILYMNTQKHILGLAKSVGFILKGRIDMVQCMYEYQYLYILYKPM